MRVKLQATILGAKVDTEVSDLEKRRREELTQALANDNSDGRKLRFMAYQLKMKRPGFKQLMGENPLTNEEFAELEKYFRMSRRPV